MSRVTDKVLQTALEKTKLYVDKEADKVRGDIPAKLSQLVNDNHTVTDESYVHTDNNFTEVDKAVVGSLPSTILTNPHVIASGGETYLNVTYDMAELVDGTYSKTTKTVSILSANPATNRAGLMSGPDKIKLDGIEEGANNYVLPAASSLVRGGVVLNTAWQAPTLVSEEADDKDLPLEIANESSASGILKPTCKVYVDDVPTEDSNKFLLSGAVHTALQGKADRTELSNVLAESTDDGVILKERGTGEVMYPQTLASLVHTSDGGNVDEGLEKAKFKVFVDMWNQAWKVNGVEYGRYDPENAPDAEHPFMGNDIWMTYEEALAVLSAPVKNGEELQRCYAYTTLRPRTNICFVESSNYIDYDLSFFATGQTELETARITHNSNGIRCKTAAAMFSGCIKLTDVFGIMIDLSKSVWTNTFHHCYRLKEVRIKGLLHDISFEDSPPLSYESISYLVANAANTGSITITVHADVYAKLTGESNTEWHQVLLDAAEKQITFATT